MSISWNCGGKKILKALKVIVFGDQDGVGPKAVAVFITRLLVPISFFPLNHHMYYVDQNIIFKSEILPV